MIVAAPLQPVWRMSTRRLDNERHPSAQQQAKYQHDPRKPVSIGCKTARLGRHLNEQPRFQRDHQMPDSDGQRAADDRHCEGGPKIVKPAPGFLPKHVHDLANPYSAVTAGVLHP